MSASSRLGSVVTLHVHKSFDDTVEKGKDVNTENLRRMGWTRRDTGCD